ncbi:tetratricopeptide repeat protein [Myxococcota bacterium]|nr:tetratricopeptide repeat protein [Myxococcota bacterium]
MSRPSPLAGALLLAALSLGLGLPAGAEPVPEAARTAWVQAREAARTRDTRKALAAVEKAISAAPGFIPAHRMRIDLLTGDARGAEAVRLYRAKVDAEPRSAAAHYLYGVAANRPDVAEAEFRAAIELEPGFAWAWFGIGAIESARGRHEAAEKAYREAVRLDPDIPEAWGKLAEARLARGDEEGAIEAFREQIRRAPDDWHGRLNLGGLFALKGQMEEARPLLARAVEQAPDEPVPHVNLGFLLLRAGDASGAARHLDRAVALDPRNLVARDYRAFARAVAGGQAPIGALGAFESAVRAAASDPASAAPAFASLAEQAPRFWLAHVRHGVALAAASQGDEAAAALGRALALAPEEPEVHYGLGMVRLAAGDGAAADAAFRQSLSLRPDDAEALTGRALVAASAGRPAEGASFLARAVEVAPWEVSLRFDLAAAWEAAGETEEAERVLERIVELQPGFLPGRLQLARAYAAHDRWDDARRQLLEAVSLAPGSESVASQLRALDASRAEANEKHAGKVRASVLVTGDRARAEAALSRLRGGASFAAVAREVSTGPTAARGGDLGWIGKGEIQPPLEVALFGLDPGQVSPVVESGGSYFVVKRTR